MELIFHERQEGSLCAQHCLNALLQGSYFTAVDLGAISEELDEQERERMAEGGVTSEEYRRFLDQPSTNMDDSGFFSVQVISRALSVWSLEMIPFGSTASMAVEARKDPVGQNAFVCNFREHWFSVRKIGYQWFNLNSVLTGPELISPTYLSLFLSQLQQEGYSIFIVNGSLPDCEADPILRLVPATQAQPPRLIREQRKKALENANSIVEDDLAIQAAIEASRNEIDDEDSSLQRAMAASLMTAGEHDFGVAAQLSLFDVPSSLTSASASTTSTVDEDHENESLRRALELSLQAASSGVPNVAEPSAAVNAALSAASPTTAAPVTASSTAVAPAISMEDMRKKRLAFLEKQDGGAASVAANKAPDPAEATSKSEGSNHAAHEDEDDLTRALKMSQEQ